MIAKNPVTGMVMAQGPEAGTEKHRAEVGLQAKEPG